MTVSVATFTPAAPTATPSPYAPPGTALPPTPGPPQDAHFPATDGTDLAATFYPPGLAPAPCMLMLHMLGGSRADWDEFARHLQARGVAGMALDLRGHGQSGGSPDWPKAPGDVRAAWDALVARPEVDPQACAIVGASIGANLALIVGANNGDVAAVAALSPGLDYRGVRPAELLSNFGQRPVLFIASQDDGYSYDSVQQMARLAPAGETYYFTTAGHGTQMFSDPALERLLTEWLLKQLGVLKG